MARQRKARPHFFAPSKRFIAINHPASAAAAARVRGAVKGRGRGEGAVSYTHLRAHETEADL
eukprot:597155-Rhodomonas_salina.1